MWQKIFIRKVTEWQNHRMTAEGQGKSSIAPTFSKEKTFFPILPVLATTPIFSIFQLPMSGLDNSAKTCYLPSLGEHFLTAFFDVNNKHYRRAGETNRLEETACKKGIDHVFRMYKQCAISDISKFNSSGLLSCKLKFHIHVHEKGEWHHRLAISNYWSILSGPMDFEIKRDTCIYK